MSVAALYGASADSGLISLLPADTQAVFSVNAQEARASALGQSLLQNMVWNDAKFQGLMAATGFDPRRDLLNLVVATSSLNAPADARRGRVAVLVRGNFDATKIGQAALDHGSQIQNINGVNVYTSPQGGSPHGFALLGVDVAAMGDLDSLRAIISNRTSPSHLDPDFSRLLDKASSDGEIWFASSGLARPLSAMAGAPNHSQAQQFNQILQGVVQSSGGLKLGTEVQLSFDAVARSDKDANSLADVIRFLASAAQVKRDQDPQAKLLAPALDNMSLNTNGNELHLTTSVPENLLEQMAPHSRANPAPAR